MKYENDSKADHPAKLREMATDDVLELPVPTEPFQSWSGLVDPVAVIEFSGRQLKRFWSDPEFVRRRETRRINVPFEMP
jgi:hypothetical protein